MLRTKRGVSLTEIMIATVIMVLVSVPVIALFMTSKQTITRTDNRREKRYFLNEMLGRAQKHSLHVLWRYFGPYYAGGLGGECGYMRNEICIVDTNGKIVPRPANITLDGAGGRDTNPLGFSQDFIHDMRAAKYEARIRFEFYRRDKLGIKRNGAVAPFDPAEKVAQLSVGNYGVQHLQAGIIGLGVRSTDPSEDQTPEIWIVPIMCPAIVGRPGLKMEGCPALSEDYTDADGSKFNFHKVYGELVARREADSTEKGMFED